MATTPSLPQVRTPLRLKIIFPYLLLALAIAVVAVYLVNRLVLDTIAERFTNQLIEDGKLTADQLVYEENRLLETLRLVARTQGMPAALRAADAEQLRTLVLPIAINFQEEAVDILDTTGKSILSLRHAPGQPVEDYAFAQGDPALAQGEFVQNVLAGRTDAQGDKYAGLVQTEGSTYFYVAGPIVDEAGQLVGVALVGKSLASLASQIRQETLAHITFFDIAGQPLFTNLPLVTATALAPAQTQTVLNQQDTTSLIRELQVNDRNYSEIVGPWEVRGGLDLGFVSTARPQTFLVLASQFTRVQIMALVVGAFGLIIVVGFYLASLITRPLLRVVNASTEIAQGNLEVKVKPVGSDEIAVLAHSFNQMVAGLREGFIYHDLLGRSVSPEVREQLRAAFASGDLRLAGQHATASILISDIRGFTTLSEKVAPETVLAWLNEYFGVLVPIVAAHGGVVNAFEGDSMLAFFGVLPRALPEPASAYVACQVALEIAAAVERLNTQRAARNEPPFVTGISINTGEVTVGSLGTAARLHYTLLGDTVNTTARLQEMTRAFGENAIVIGEATWSALGERRAEFQAESLGAQTFRGKSQSLLAYRLWARGAKPEPPA